MNRKTKILAYMDTPTCATGFGSVARNILMGLYSTGKYEIEILGINYFGDPHQFPFRIWPVAIGGPDGDPYGRKKIFNMIPQMEFDILFFLQDTFILNFLPELIPILRSRGKKFKSIVYYPIDGMPRKEWINNIAVCDTMVAYTQFGKQMTIEAYPELTKEIKIIPHGVNTNEFFPILDREKVAHFRKQFFGVNSDKFIFTNVNRNQRRKDIPRTIMAFKEFRKEVPNSLLYLHMAKKDQGWDIEQLCASLGLNTRTDVILPENFGPNQGFPREIVNYIYNASDCVISTTHGEGFGCTWLESMATRTPVIMPNNTAMPEFITEERGYLVRSGGDINLYTVLNLDNEVVRPVVDTKDMVDKMLHVYNNRVEATHKADVAYKWVVEGMDWHRSIVPMWVALFDSMVKDLHLNQNVVTDTNRTINTELF